MAKSAVQKAWLALETGDVYDGVAAGARGESAGELVFNTGMTGYVEVLTDPSYHGQIVVVTNPHVGNYGVQPADYQWSRPAVAGFCVQEQTERPHHGGSRDTLRSFLSRHEIVSIAGVATRDITLRLRARGSLRGLVTTERASPKALVEKARRSPRMEGRSLVAEVTTAKPYVWKGGAWRGKKRVAVLDFGVKRSLLDALRERGCSVKVFPAATAVERLLSEEPDAFVLSNGPGDPAALGPLIANVGRVLRSDRPVLGVCLGHQLMGLALGGKSYKLPFGHHGINHPVRDEKSRTVMITTQNHGFAIAAGSLPRSFAPTHVSLNDGTLEGFRHRRKPLFALQFHPEAAPGPLEGRQALSEFISAI